MKRYALFLLMMISASALYGQAASAAKKAAATTKTELTGYLTDVQCGESLENLKMAQDHTKECALMPGCMKSGYGLYTDGKLVKFDKAGSDKALSLLKGTKKEKDLKVKVTGEKKGDTFTLAAIEFLP
jgi:hypothetical protein